MSEEQTIADRASEGYAKLFPALTPAQQQRLYRFGKRRQVSAGAVLFQQGAPKVPFFVVISGRMQIVQPKQQGEESIVIHEPGEFTGEANMLSGRRSLVIGRMLTAGEVLEIPNDALRSIIQTESDLSDILMRAFILRRLELIQLGLGDVVVLGSQHSARTLEIREFLARNGHPFAYVDLDRDEGAQEMLEHFGVSTQCIPVVVCRGKTIL